MSKSVRSQRWNRHNATLTRSDKSYNPQPVYIVNPKTGEYESDDVFGIKKDDNSHKPSVFTYILRYRGYSGFMRSIQYQAKKNGYNSLTEKQIDAVKNVMRAHSARIHGVRGNKQRVKCMTGKSLDTTIKVIKRILK